MKTGVSIERISYEFIFPTDIQILSTQTYILLEKNVDRIRKKSVRHIL
jgi:hypothetical protein